MRSQVKVISQNPLNPSTQPNPRPAFFHALISLPLKRAMNPPQGHLPFRQSPRPKSQRDTHIEEIENQRPAKDDCVERPRSFFGQPDLGDDDGPGEDPEEVGSEGLVEIPAGTGGEEDGG